MKPFRVEVDDATIEDLRRRLERTRWPDQIPGSGWDYGTDGAYLRELCEYWRTGFDWRATEATINHWPQFVTNIDGQRLHFIHARSDQPDALPLLITHGWPGSVLEFLKIIGPLTDPVRLWRIGRGRLPRCLPVDAGIRLERADDRAGMGYPPGGRSRGRPDGRPSVTTATGPRAGTGEPSPPGRWACSCLTGSSGSMSTWCSPYPPRSMTLTAGLTDAGAGRARRWSAFRQGRVRLPGHPGDQTADPGLRALRLAGGAGRLDRGEVPDLE